MCVRANARVCDGQAIIKNHAKRHLEGATLSLCAQVQLADPFLHLPLPPTESLSVCVYKYIQYECVLLSYTHGLCVCGETFLCLSLCI